MNKPFNRQCHICHKETRKPIADGWITVDKRHERKLIWQCAECTDEINGPTTTIAELWLPLRKG